jgi:rhamnosyltransferase subunit B
LLLRRSHRKRFAVSEITPHYLVMTVGTTGDMHPFMRIAGTLQSLGRKVTFIANVHHAKLVQDAGLRFVGLGTEADYQRIVDNPDLWDPRRGFSVLMADYRELLAQIDDVIQSARGEAPLVAIAHPLVVPAAAISKERGAINAIVAAYLAPSNLRSSHDPLHMGPAKVPAWVPMRWRRALWRFVEKSWIDPLAVAQINAAREPLGLRKVHSFLTHIAEAPDLSVTLFPSWFAPPVPDWPRPLLMGDFQLFDPAAQHGFSQELTAFLAAGESPLVFTAGTGNLHAADFFAVALSAVERLGRRAVFLTRERAQLPTRLPASVLWQPYVPLSALLPHAAVIVHHGGIGTTAEALRAGTPQLVAPFAWDQFDNGARVAALGVGMVVPARRLHPRTLARTLQALATSGDMRARCLRYAAHCKPPHDPAGLCSEIERFVMASSMTGQR